MLKNQAKTRFNKASGGNKTNNSHGKAAIRMAVLVSFSNGGANSELKSGVYSTITWHYSPPLLDKRIAEQWNQQIPEEASHATINLPK